LCDESGLDLYLHALYLINLASSDDTIWENSIKTLVWNMKAAKELRAKAVTFHVGSHLGSGFASVRPRIRTAIERVLAECPVEPLLLLENSAGAGGCVGGSMEELGTIVVDAGMPPNLGVCLDTAHAFAMGCDLRSSNAVDDLIRSIDAYVGIERLRLIHLNDSQTELGSRKDRHENIGSGFIGREGFSVLLRNPTIVRLPLILETPNIARRSEEFKMLQKLASRELKGASPS